MSDAQVPSPLPQPRDPEKRYSPWFPRELDQIRVKVIQVDGKSIDLESCKENESTTCEQPEAVPS